jgi:hypothetical protein
LRLAKRLVGECEGLLSRWVEPRDGIGRVDHHLTGVELNLTVQGLHIGGSVTTTLPYLIISL